MLVGLRVTEPCDGPRPAGAEAHPLLQLAQALKLQEKVYANHPTILHLHGMDRTKPTHRFNGRDMRLTDVYRQPVPQIVAN